MLQNYEKFGKRLHKHELQASFCKSNIELNRQGEKKLLKVYQTLSKTKKGGEGGGGVDELQKPLKHKGGNKDSLNMIHFVNY